MMQIGIGFYEILIILCLALIVIKPKHYPETIQTIAKVVATVKQLLLKAKLLLKDLMTSMENP